MGGPTSEIDSRFAYDQQISGEVIPDHPLETSETHPPQTLDAINYGVYHLKCNLKTTTYHDTKIKPEAGAIPCKTLPTYP
jgi:hypothetical protein